ncbi:MAG: MBL fold metallo-hydrolase [Pseudomonadales bacterium]|nr:MBL fold metallo-hydrolase [Pseudomonadales bacterium]
MITLEPGRISELSPRVRRIIAPNPSVMTGPGTNTYLLGREQIAVIDPGPADAAHLDAIIAAGDGRIRWIVVTHTHEDHSPAAAPLARATGAELWGAAAPEDFYQDHSFVPDVPLAENMRLETAEFALRAIHTPGHVSNHYCLLLEEEGMLFTGDHIMNGSTVVIIPPSGDMKDYLDSLEKLKAYPLRQLAPGHGELMPEPVAAVDALITHRLKREAKVLASLATRGGGTLDELLPLAYDDVPVALHPMAKYSLWAHLLKLERESRAHCRDERWGGA